MDKMKILNRIQELYIKDENIIQYLKEQEKGEINSIEDIMISYDFQAGKYIQQYKKDSSFKRRYSLCIAKIIEGLGEFNSMLEVGVGEATTLGPLLSCMQKPPNKSYGLDISWSRIKYARRFLSELNINDVELFTGDLFCTPLKDNSIDIVYTSHSIEPNGGRERDALIELYRITNKYLILLEPSYELADEVSRKRMISHGYVTNLYSIAKELGFDIIEYKLFELSANPLNPTGLIIIKKGLETKTLDPICCPLTKTNILKKKDAYYSKESLLAYPVVGEIPCLLPQNAIVATKFLD